MENRNIPVITKPCLIVILALSLALWIGVARATVGLDQQFMEAVKDADAPSVVALLDKGADVNAVDEHGKTSLIRAAMGGNLEITKLLVQKGAAINARDKNDWTALMAAAWNGYANIVRLLLDTGAYVNAQQKNGLTALMMGSLQGHPEVVKLLLEKGASINTPNETGMTALMMGSFQGHTEVVKLLLEKGADVSPKNRWGNTALSIASSKGHVQIAELLKTRGDMSAKLLIIVGTIKLIVIAIILAIIARLGHDRPLMQTFFQSQNWTLNDAYKIVIPLLPLVYLQFVLHQTLPQYASFLSLIFGSTYCIVIYGSYYLFIKKVYRISSTTFGLNKENFLNIGIRHANIALILVLLSVTLEPKIAGPSVVSTDKSTNSVLFANLTTVLLGVFMVPILEEVLFRGILYAPVARKIGAWKAMSLLAVVSSLWHLHYTGTYVLGNIVVSFLLYYGYVKRTSLYVPIIWHIAFNFMCIRSDLATALAVYTGGYISDRYYIFVIAFILLAINFTWLISSLRRARSQHTRKSC